TDIGADVSGVPEQEDTAGLISLRLTAVDTVSNAPHGIAQHAARGPSIEHRLEILQGRRSRRRMIFLGWAGISNDGSATSRQWENGEHARGSEEGELFIARQLPVDPDICRDEIGRIIVAGE